VAQPAPSAYGLADLDAIVDASQHNEARFRRDYLGRSFRATLPFDSASEGLFSSGGNYLVFLGHGSVHCTIDNPAMIAQIADLRRGQPLTVSGTIYDTTLGDLLLRDCAVH
jgi:hypothetical protein